jgi:hypothetical protein
MPELFAYLAAELRHRWRRARDTIDGGYSTETVVVTALLVTLGILVIGLLATKVWDKVNAINLG